MDSLIKDDNEIEDVQDEVEVHDFAVYKEVDSVYDYKKEEKEIGKVYVHDDDNQVINKKIEVRDVKEVVENIEQKHAVISYVLDINVEEIVKVDPSKVVEKN